MRYDEDCCKNCGYYWNGDGGSKCCNCPESRYDGKVRSKYDVCGQYTSRESWKHEIYKGIAKI